MQRARRRPGKLDKKKAEELPEPDRERYNGQPTSVVVAATATVLATFSRRGRRIVRQERLATTRLKRCDRSRQTVAIIHRRTETNQS
jgi:hypothetical protein